MEKITAVVMAGGKGTRMKSQTQKVLHLLGKEPMIFYSIRNLLNSDINKIYVVIGYQGNQVARTIQKRFEGIEFAHQEQPLGTGHALKSALAVVDPKIKTLLVVGGDDSAFYTPDTIKNLITSHTEANAAITMMTLNLGGENSFGKVIRDKNGKFKMTLEDKEYREGGYQSNEINCGAYIINSDWARHHIDKILLSQKGEYYINELLNIAAKEGDKVNLFVLQKPSEWRGINNQEELREANKLLEATV